LPGHLFILSPLHRGGFPFCGTFLPPQPGDSALRSTLPFGARTFLPFHTGIQRGARPCPLRSFCPFPAAGARHRARGLLSWGCPVLQRINTRDVSPYWLSDPSAALALAGGLPRVSVPPLPPEVLTPPASASPGLRPPFRVWPERPPSSLRSLATPLGFRPLQRSRCGESRTGISTPGLSVFRVSHPLDGLILPEPSGPVSYR